MIFSEKHHVTNSSLVIIVDLSMRIKRKNIIVKNYINMENYEKNFKTLCGRGAEQTDDMLCLIRDYVISGMMKIMPVVFILNMTDVVVFGIYDVLTAVKDWDANRKDRF